MKRKLKYLVLMAASLFALTGFSQSTLQPGEMTVIQTRPVSFSYTDPEELLNVKTIENTFELKLNSGPATTKVYASVMMTSGVAPELHRLLVLHLSYKSSPTAAVQQVDIPLSSVPTLLFTQPPGGSNQVVQYAFSYDVRLLPSQTFIKPGDYPFNIIFSKSSQ